MCEKFFAKNSSIVAFDEKMLYYTKTIEEINSTQRMKDIEFVRLSLRSFIESVINHAKEWMKCLGRLLSDMSRENLLTLKAQLEVRFLITYVYFEYKFHLFKEI